LTDNFTMKKSLFLLLPFFYSGTACTDDVFTADFADDLSHVRASLCFDGPPPGRLYRNKNAAAFSSDIYHLGKPLGVSKSGSSIRLPNLPDDACINWQTDLDAALENRSRRIIFKRGQDLLMSADLWFWKGSRHRALQVEVLLPDGVSFATPWPVVETGSGDRYYRPDKTQAGWSSTIAIGYFEIETISVAGSQINMAVVGQVTDQQNRKFRNWIGETASAVGTVVDGFPQPQAQVLIVPIGKRREAVVSGHIQRGGGLSAEFFVDETRPQDEFTSDWTAMHEFSHMLLPYVSRRDRWLSEGLASYYQNVLLARSGRLSETQAWQKLYEGFKRGEKGTRGGSLAEATKSGRRSTMRVYWSGAALMLLADMQLRSASDGRQSLDSALKALSSCCMENGKTWRAKELFSRLDGLTGTRVFSDLYARYVDQGGFPDMRPAWEELGINIRNGQVNTSQNAPMADVRNAIMKG